MKTQKTSRRPHADARPFVLLITAALAAVVAAQSQPGQSVPTFRFGADRLTLDASVVDSTGHTVSNLNAGDFQVTIDGKLHQVTSAEWVPGGAASGEAVAPATPQSAARSGAEDALNATFSSNERGELAGMARPSRDVVIAIDQNSFESGASRAVASAAQQLLERFPAGERVGLAAYPAPIMRLAPTRDRARLTVALGQVTGVADRLPYTETGLTVGDALVVARGGDQLQARQVIDRECNTTTMTTAVALPGESDACRQRVTIAARTIQVWARRRSLVSLTGLRDLVASLGSTGRPATIVLVSSGVILGDSSHTIDLETETRELSDLAAAAQVSLHGLFVDSSFLDAAGLDGDRVRGFANTDRDLRRGGLQTLAGLSGGSVANLQGKNDDVFSRLASELEGYYLLAVECAPADRDGKVHKVQVRVGKAGLAIRSREQVLVPMARSYVGDEAVTFALNSPPIQRGIPISVSTQVLRDPGASSVRVVIAGNIGRGVAGADDVRVGYSLRTTVGGEGTSGVESRKLSATGIGADATLQFVDSVVVVPGHYLLRLAALDSAGRLGSVDHVVDATLVELRGAMMSELMLVDPLRKSAGALSPIADGRITGSQLEALVEIYPQPGQNISEVAFAIADSPTGPAMLSGRSSATERDKAAKRTAAVSIDMSSLPPGIYTAVASVFDGTKLLGRASRPFRLDRLMVAAGGPRAPFSVAATGGPVRQFDRKDVLRPDAMSYFLGRMQAADSAAAAGPIAAAADALRGGRYDEVEKSLADTRNDQLSAVFLKGVALFAKGDLEPAAAQFRATLHLSNDFLPAAFYLGACYAAGGRDREAVGAWQTSLISESDARIVYDVLADALLRLKEGKQAASVLAEARERWPDDDVMLPRMAAAQVLMGRPAEALATLAPYIERHPKDSDAIFLALRVLYEAHAVGGRVGSASDDAQAARKYGALYGAAGGPDLALVERWVAFVVRGK